jgi:hypothetical protein
MSIPTTNKKPTHVTPALSHIDKKFDIIYSEIEKQRAYSASFDTQITSLEITTKNIDSKIDILLDQMASSPSLTHKHQCTSRGSITDALSYPRHAAENTDQGLMESCIP